MNPHPPAEIQELRKRAQAIPPDITKDIISILLYDETIFETTKAARNEIQILRAFVNVATHAMKTKAIARETERLDKRRHCVRCHDTYIDRNNKDGSCKIPHIFEEEMLEYESGYHRALCCDEVVRQEYDRDMDEIVFPRIERLNLICWEGKHTEIPVRASYDGLNFRRCHYSGPGARCSRRCVMRDDSDPPCFEEDFGEEDKIGYPNDDEFPLDEQEVDIDDDDDDVLFWKRFREGNDHLSLTRAYHFALSLCLQSILPYGEYLIFNGNKVACNFPDVGPHPPFITAIIFAGISGPFSQWVIKHVGEGAYSITKGGSGFQAFVRNEEEGASVNGNSEKGVHFAIEPAGRNEYTIKTVNHDLNWTVISKS